MPVLMEKATKLSVIITGASTGIGRELALIFAREGYNIGLMARRSGLLEELQKEIAQKYPDCQIHMAPCDITHEEESRQTVFSLHQKLGSLDLFIANAGIGAPTPAFESNWNSVRAILQTNIMGTIASLEAAKEIMLKQGSGHLVGISSVSSFRGLPASSAYCASKAALSTYLEAIRVDLKNVGIMVTSIHPGFILTPMTEKNKYMPFLLSASRGSEKIFRAIKKKKARHVFPWPMKALTYLMYFMPDSLYDWLISLKYRHGVFR